MSAAITRGHDHWPGADVNICRTNARTVFAQQTAPDSKAGPTNLLGGALAEAILAWQGQSTDATRD